MRIRRIHYWIKTVMILALAVGLSATGLRAQDHGDHRMTVEDQPDTVIAPSRFPDDYRSPAKPPPSDKAIRKYAIDDTGPGATSFGVAPVHDNPTFYTINAHRTEWRTSGEVDEQVFLWDVALSAGNNDARWYLESEGEWAEGHDEAEAATLEGYYAVPVTAFWDLRYGIRQDVEPEPRRTFAVIGLMGLAPQWFETTANLNIGENSDIRVDLESEYNLLLSQRLVFQPRLETEVAFEDQPELNLGIGFTGVELGGRLRYELHRKFAPYVGLSYESPLGETKDIAEDNGANPGTTFTVFGVKWWF